MHAQKKHALVLARVIQTLSPTRHAQKNHALVLARAILPITPLATFGCRPVLAKRFSGIVALFKKKRREFYFFYVGTQYASRFFFQGGRGM